ncbi:hypothetical protein FH972_002534 [Carpinus fangiana]|uniref:Uncharacterized protein n=1 Tax=Carpinus fangiana TaxID=176857 RepID=A0A5N6QF61_9ROSI|nr:hypothetical protein FH972_002534 [Carpinus fangiana]
MGSTSSNIGGNYARRPTRVVDTASGESPASETRPVGVSRAEAPAMESFHVGVDHGAAGKEGNGCAFIIGEEDREKTGIPGGGCNSSKKGQNLAVNGVLNEEDLWGLARTGMRAETGENLRELIGERQKVQNGGNDVHDLRNEGGNVRSGKGKSVKLGTDVRDGKGKKENMRQGGPSVFNFGSEGNLKGQQREACLMG